ncbi:MAG TPA: hypothetical protein VF613_11935 [Longimicrobium sp.]
MFDKSTATNGREARLADRLRSSSTRLRAGSTVVLLALALVVVSVLALQAVRSARANRAFAERVLRDHASVATWELTTQADATMIRPLIASFLPTVGVLHEPGGGGVQPLHRFAASISGDSCGCMQGIRTYFRVDLSTGAAEWLPASPDSASSREWILDTLRPRLRHGADSGDALRRARGGAVGSGGATPGGESRIVLRDASGRRAPVVLGSGSTSFGLAGGGRGAHRGLIAFGVLAGPGGGSRWVYGFETEPAPFLAPVLRRVVNGSPLLPPPLL